MFLRKATSVRTRRRWAGSRAARAVTMRSVTSSTVPRASTSTTSPRSRVDRRSAAPSAAVDLLAVTDAPLRCRRQRPSSSARLRRRSTTSSTSATSCTTASRRRRRPRSVEFLDLLGRARVPVEQEAAGHVGLGQSVANEIVGQRIGHVLARLNDRLDLSAEFGPFLDIGPEDVAGRDRGDAVDSASRAAWVPLPAPGGPMISRRVP